MTIFQIYVIDQYKEQEAIFQLSDKHGISNDDILNLSMFTTRVALWKPGQWFWSNVGCIAIEQKWKRFLNRENNWLHLQNR